MVVASSASWWLTAAAAGRCENDATADSGTITTAPVLRAEPLAWSRSEGLIGAVDAVVVDVVVPVPVGFAAPVVPVDVAAAPAATCVPVVAPGTALAAATLRAGT